MPRLPARVAVFLSGGGTGFQSLVDATKNGALSADIVWVVSSSKKAFGLERAAREGIESFVYRPKKYYSPEAAAEDLMAQLKEKQVDYIALSGYLKLLPANVVRAFKGRITNIHPALLPKHGGKGMYGINVHRAVLDSGDKETGPTIHLVDEIYDHGKILAQVRIPVSHNETAEELAARVLVEEHKLYPATLEKLIRGDYEL